MLACIPRHQNFSSQHLVCTTTRVLEVVPSLALPIAPPPPPPPPPQQQSYIHKGVSVSMATRYPTPAELDAFAQRTASSPLSIIIFPSNVRVPQHKQLSRTVNGLDTTGQRYSPYSHPPSGGSRGLLAVVKGSAHKGVVKSSDGRRTKHAPPQTPPAPFSNPQDGGGGGGCYAPDRRLHNKAYDHGGAGTPQVAATNGPSSGVTATSRGQAPPPHDRPRLNEVRGALMRRVNAAAAAAATGREAPPPRGGVARVSPSHQAVAAVACSDSGFVLGVPPPQSGLAFSGAVLPTQSADMAKVGYLEGGDYGVWQHKHPPQPHHQHQQQHHQLQQQYQQGSMRMFSGGQGSRGAESMVGQSPQSSLPPGCSARPSYRPHPLSAGAGGAAREHISSHAAGDFPLGPRYLGPAWDGQAGAAPLTDCYAQELALPRDTGHAHPHPHAHPQNCLDPHHHHHHHHHPHHHHRPNQPQCHLPTPAAVAPPQAYSAEQGGCCGGVGLHGAGPAMGAGLCHASMLSSSLQSLECLISEIHPPCIKERMLGRGYEAVGLARLLEQHHHPHLHPQPHHHPHIHHHISIQLPVYR